MTLVNLAVITDQYLHARAHGTKFTVPICTENTVCGIHEVDCWYMTFCRDSERIFAPASPGGRCIVCKALEAQKISEDVDDHTSVKYLPAYNHLQQSDLSQPSSPHLL